MKKKAKPKSFAEVAFFEAIAQRVRLDVIVPAAVSTDERRLVSHFLGVEGQGQLALVPPQTIRGRKVYIPVDWPIGMSFELESIWFQGTSSVLAHSMFRQSPTRRIDALIVKRPGELIASNRRGKPRRKVDCSKPVLATIWPAEGVSEPKLKPLEVGKVHDWSETGLGIMVAKPLDVAIGRKVIIGLDTTRKYERLFLWGVLKHCVLRESDAWLAGFGEVANVRAGEAVDFMELLSTSSA